MTVRLRCSSLQAWRGRARRRRASRRRGTARTPRPRPRRRGRTRSEAGDLREGGHGWESRRGGRGTRERWRRRGGRAASRCARRGGARAACRNPAWGCRAPRWPRGRDGRRGDPSPRSSRTTPRGKGASPVTHSRSAPATRASVATVKAGGSAERFQKWVVLRRKRAATAESSPRGARFGNGRHRSNGGCDR